MHSHRRRLAALSAATIALTAGAAGPALAKGNPNSSAKLTKAVTAEAVYDHLEAFQAIADDNGGNRAAGTPGYEASAEYVEDQLRAAGYDVERQYFTFTYSETLADSLVETSPDAETHPNTPMTYSTSTPDGGITGRLVAPKDPLGCTAAAWDGIDVTGQIALVQRGGCTFAEKSVAAQQAGAAAAIIYNNADGALNGTLGEVVGVPTTGISQALGQEFLGELADGPVTVTLDLRTLQEDRETFNLIAETDTGREDNVVMLGAHLDGALEGPGINDNGSGSAAILETAIQLAEVNKLNNQVRFVWWGAEENGLLGSWHYMDDLYVNDRAELGNIATYLNFDMVASPNYVIGVYDADESTHAAPVEVPGGSAETEAVFTDYFDGIGQPWVDTEFSGRSDYQAFIEYGVPASGLFTGGDGTKTPAEVEMFGGTAGVTYDPNYHTAGDDLSNVNVEALDIMSDAIAHAAITLAQDTSSVNGERSAGKSGKAHPQGPLAAA